MLTACLGAWRSLHLVEIPIGQRHLRCSRIVDDGSSWVPWAEFILHDENAYFSLCVSARGDLRHGWSFDVLDQHNLYYSEFMIITGLRIADRYVRSAGKYIKCGYNQFFGE